MDDNTFRLAVSAATYHLAHELFRAEDNAERRKKKKRVVEVKWEALKAQFPSETSKVEPARPGAGLALLPSKIKGKDALAFLIDVSFCDPFAPYELKYKDSHFHDALTGLAKEVGLSEADVKAVEKTKKSAFKAHKHIAWTKIALYTVGGATVLALGGWMAAPVIGGVLGGAGTTLAGAAAASHGLALLGGGSLAMGGAGMAGGMALVVGVGGVGGGVLVGGGSLLLQLGAANAKVELVKLQTTYKLTLLATQGQVAKAQAVTKSLVQQKKEIEKKLEEERALNEKGSRRLKDLEATVQAVEDALAWIENAGKK